MRLDKLIKNDKNFDVYVHMNNGEIYFKSKGQWYQTKVHNSYIPKAKLLHGRYTGTIRKGKRYFYLLVGKTWFFYIMSKIKRIPHHEVVANML